MASDVKWCYGCKCDRPIDQFNRNSSRPDGLQSRCKRCERIRQRERYAKEVSADEPNEHNPCDGCKFLMDCTYNVNQNYEKPAKQLDPYCWLSNPHHEQFIKAYRRSNGTHQSRSRQGIVKALLEEKSKRKHAANRKAKRQERVTA